MSWLSTRLREVSLIRTLLSRAVPDIQVDSVMIVKSLGDQYWLLVIPSHYKYWDYFGRTYPCWKQVAYKYRVLPSSVTGTCCPVFSTQKGLLDWLSDVLCLSLGERKLLYLVENVVG